MTDERTVYVCPTCKAQVMFHPGFILECKGRPGNPRHTFTWAEPRPELIY